MAWIESHQSLGTHPKLFRVCQQLNITDAQAVGHLQYFWWWCIDYAPSGDVSRFDALQIARAARWANEAGEFLEALVSAGFLDRDGEQMMVHDWLDFCGELVKQRCRRLKEKRRTMRHVFPSKPNKSPQIPGIRPNQPNQPDRTLTEPTQPTKGDPAPLSRTRRVPAESLSAPVWEAYAKAYRTRYGVDPQRNQRVNATLKQLRERVGAEQAPAVAAFYVTHNDALYVRSRHPTTLLLRDAEGLMTQLLTGQKATRQEAMQAETKDAIRDQVARVSVLLGASHDAK